LDHLSRHAKPLRHLRLPTEAPAAEAEGYRAPGAGDRAEGEVRQRRHPAGQARSSCREASDRHAAEAGEAHNVGAPDMTPEEFQRRADAADALWVELVRLATGKDRP
jgi:hypothetical protein